MTQHMEVEVKAHEVSNSCMHIHVHLKVVLTPNVLIM